MDVTWDAAFLLAPADSDEYKYGANKIREFKTAINERFIVEHDIATGLHKPGETSILYAANEADIANLANMASGALVYADASNESAEVKRLQYYDGANWVDISIDSSVINNLLQPAPQKGGYANIYLCSNSTNAATEIDINATSVTVMDANSNLVEINDLSTVVDLTISANANANCLDTGAKAANTWYYIYALAGNITNGIAELQAAIASSNAIIPTLPANYTYYRMIGIFRTDANANLIKGRQFNNDFYYNTHRAILANGSATTFTQIALSNYTPPNYTIMALINDWLTVVSSYPTSVELSFDGVNTFFATYTYADSGGSQYIIPISANNSLYYKCAATGTPLYNAWISGYKLGI